MGKGRKEELTRPVVYGYMNLVEFFKDEAYKKNISINRLCEEAGVTRNVFYQATNLNLSSIHKLCKVLGIDTVTIEFK